MIDLDAIGAAFTADLPAYPDIAGIGWFSLTLCIYVAVVHLRQRFVDNAWTSPILMGGLILAGVMGFSNTPPEVYARGGDIWAWLLMPATVALAIPLYDQRQALRQMMRPVLLGIMCGSCAAVASALSVAVLMGVAPETFASLAPKSVTTPIALGIGREIGGLDGLIAAIVIITGLFGIVIAPPLFRWFGISDRHSQGVAYGLAAHAIGTAEAVRRDPVMGSFAALSLGVNGILSAIFLPPLMQALGN